MSLGEKRKSPARTIRRRGCGLSFPMILVFSAGSRGQWKQTKSAVALWTPSPSPPMLQWKRRGVGERMTDQHAGIVCRSHRPNRAEGSREGTSSRFILPCGVKGQRPLGVPQSTRGRCMSVSPTESRERVKGGTPLQGAGAAPLLGSRGKAPWVSPLTHSSVHPPTRGGWR